MVQDFAKIRPESVLDRNPTGSPPAWGLLFTGMLSGLALGVVACVLLYLSGMVPPLQTPLVSVQSQAAGGEGSTIHPDDGTTTPNADSDLSLDFYRTLQDYEVVVNATPLDIETAPGNGAVSQAPESTGSFLLQIGAFERRVNADSLRARVEALGLPAVIKEEPRTGRVLFLVQSGPFADRVTLGDAEQKLAANNISSTRISLITPL